MNRFNLYRFGWTCFLGSLVAWGSVLYADSQTLSLSNGSLEIVLDRDLGRLMEFTPVASARRNILWVNDLESVAAEAARGGFKNWGGDKVWPVPQPFWLQGLGRVWPPDRASDGGGAELSKESEVLALKFPLSEAFGSRLSRRFQLDADAAILRIENRLEQELSSPFPSQIWSITQVPLPQRVLMDASFKKFSAVELPVNLNAPESAAPLVPRPIDCSAILRADGWIVYRPIEGEQHKLGSLGGWIAGVWDDGILLQVVGFDGDGMYPEASSLQFYHNDNYGELETLGPARWLRPGEVLEADIHWEWLDLADAASQSDEALFERIKQAGIFPSLVEE